jgi:hypothetical protein
MKALTLHQPWASLIAAGDKTLETRHWRTAYRGPLAIYAAAAEPDFARAFAFGEEHSAACLRAAGHADVGALPRNAIIAVCNLVDIVTVAELDDIERMLARPVGAPLERLFGDFSEGRLAWVLKDVVALDEPVSCKGLKVRRQGLWDVPVEVTDLPAPARAAAAA